MLFLFVLCIIDRDFWEQLSMKPLQVDSFSRIRIHSGVWRTLQREQVHWSLSTPGLHNDYREWIAGRGGEAKLHLCYGLGEPWVYFTQRTTRDPSTQVSGGDLWNLFSPCVANCPCWGHSATVSRHRDLCEVITRCGVWSREFQRCYRMTAYGQATVSL